MCSGRYPVTHHIEVTTLEEWVRARLGYDPRARMDAARWLATPQQRLLNITAGRIQVGAIGQLTHADDAIVTHTDWPVHLTDVYRREMGVALP